MANEFNKDIGATLYLLLHGRKMFVYEIKIVEGIPIQLKNFLCEEFF